tara:strand:- start:2340 stop:2804 length:465 start_codon:yes stop_codon:yes gene_type:complete
MLVILGILFHMMTHMRSRIVSAANVQSSQALVTDKQTPDAPWSTSTIVQVIHPTILQLQYRIIVDGRATKAPGPCHRRCQKHTLGKAAVPHLGHTDMHTIKSEQGARMWLVQCFVSTSFFLHFAEDDDKVSRIECEWILSHFRGSILFETIRHL